MKAKQIRKITDASVIVALYGVIFLLSRFFGGDLEYSISFLMPLPLALYAYKYDFKTSIIPLVAGTVVSFLLSVNPINVVVVVLPYLIIGCILGGILIKKDIKAVYSILIITLLVSIIEVLASIVLSNVLGFENIFADIKNIILELEVTLGVNSGDFAIIQALMEGLIPSIIIVISLMSSLTTYLMFVLLVTRIFKTKLSLNLVEFFSIKTKLPNPLTIGYVSMCILTVFIVPLFGMLEGFTRVLGIIVINITIIVGAVYFYYGIRVTSLVIKLINKKWLLLIEFLLILLVSPVFVILGILDNLLSLQTKIYNKLSTPK